MATERAGKSSPEVSSTPLATNKSKKIGRAVTLSFLFGTSAVLGYYGYDEYKNSTLQTRFFTRWAKGEIYTKTVTTPAPATGIEDIQRGYGDIVRLRRQFTEDGDIISPLPEWKDRSLDTPLGTIHASPMFKRPAQAGVVLKDNLGRTVYQGKSPFRVYDKIEDIPEKLVKSLALVEDRMGLDEDPSPTKNTAIDWKRVGMAVLQQSAKKLHLAQKADGGSTMAIQNSKRENTPRGITKSFHDKVVQTVDASLKVYSAGADTSDSWERTALEYINATLFAAHPEAGEIKGWRDAMAILFGNPDFEDALNSDAETAENARTFRQVFSLVLAVKMPDRSLRKEEGFIKLQERVDNFLPLLVEEKIITESFAKLVMAEKLDFSDLGKNAVLPEKPELDKSAESLRLALMNKLRLNPVDGMYKLDRWDLEAESALDYSVNASITEKLRSFNDPETAKKFGLTGFQLLRPETAPKVTWAITITEKLPDGRNVVRVSTDTFKGALDLTQGGKMQYGSTAKLRMYVTYLQTVNNLYAEFADKDPDTLRKTYAHPKDKLTQWALQYLSDPTTDKSQEAMLRASLERKFSGSIRTYFTGRGLITPQNFDKKENYHNYNVNEALWESVNQSWFRITEELEEHMKWHRLATDPEIFTDPDNPLRRQYLEEFADGEAKIFMFRAWKEQKGKTIDEIASMMAKTKSGRNGRSPTQLAVIFFSAYPDGTHEQMANFIRENCNNCKTKDDFRKLYQQHAPEKLIDIATVLAKKTDGSPEQLIEHYRSLHPKATYAETREFISRVNPDISPFKDFTKEFAAYIPNPELESLLAAKTDRSPTQLAALYGVLHPNSSYDDMKAFILKEINKRKPGQDFKKEHRAYASGKYNPDTWVYNFDLNDRGYLARIHPLALRMIEENAKTPNLTWNQAVERTSADRIFVYKWLLESNKFEAQNKAVGIILSEKAWKPIEKSWQDLGFPFRLVPSYATSIGVSGDTTNSLATLNTILLNGGLEVKPSHFTSLHFAKGTPHEMLVQTGQPSTKRLLPEVIARLTLEASEGVVKKGTGRRLKDGFFLGADIPLAPGMQVVETNPALKRKNSTPLPANVSLVVRGKTGTNDESETSGVRAGVFTGTIGDRFSFCIAGYITDASPKDKFTSGLAVQALKMLQPELLPLFQRSYGIAVSPQRLVTTDPPAAPDQVKKPTVTGEKSVKSGPQPT